MSDLDERGINVACMIDEAVARVKATEQTSAVELRMVPKTPHFDSKPSLAGLAYALRHPDTWPVGFEWDFRSQYKCAMGLANRLWGIQPSLYEMMETFDLTHRQAEKMFLEAGRKWFGLARLAMCEVTPEIVAARIDLHIKKYGEN